MSAKDEHSTTSPAGDRISDLRLERFLLDELDSTESARIEQRLKHDESLRERLEQLKTSNEETLESYPVSWMASEIRSKLEALDSQRDKDARRAALQSARSSSRPQRSHFWPIPALSLAAAAIAILVLLPPAAQWFSGEPETIVDTRIKGLDPQLRLFRRTETGSERLESGATAREHDRILVQYDAAGRAYGAIVSVDGRGAITRHSPLEGSTALPLRQGEVVSLDFSYELDDAPRWEKFYFVTSDSPFGLDVVLGAAEDMLAATGAARGDSLRLPPTLDQTIFTLRKEGNHE